MKHHPNPSYSLIFFQLLSDHVLNRNLSLYVSKNELFLLKIVWGLRLQTSMPSTAWGFAPQTTIYLGLSPMTNSWLRIWPPFSMKNSRLYAWLSVLYKLWAPIN